MGCLLLNVIELTQENCQITWTVRHFHCQNCASCYDSMLSLQRSYRHPKWQLKNDNYFNYKVRDRTLLTRRPKCAILHKNILKQDWITVKGESVLILLTLIWTWPWLWPRDLDTEMWPRYYVYQKRSLYVKPFQSFEPKQYTQTRFFLLWPWPWPDDLDI